MLASVGVSPTEEADYEALLGIAGMLGPLHERVGEILRRLDDDEDAQHLGAGDTH
jgi:hypothetical protein